MYIKKDLWLVKQSISVLELSCGTSLLIKYEGSSLISEFLHL
jgi:hypothetical protein